MDWDGVQTFLACARSGSLRGAAETLGVNHATITRRLEALERSLGARLFDRAPRGLTLTAAGSEMLGSAERMEAEAHLIRRRIAGRDARPSGRVRVTMPLVLAITFLTPALARFAAAYPAIDLDLQMTNRILHLHRNEADVSLRMSFGVEDDDAVVRRLATSMKCVYGAPSYFAARPNLRIGDGAEASWIGWGKDGEDRLTSEKPAWVRESPYPQAPLRHSCPDPEFQIEAAAAGMGISYLPTFMGDADPRLQRAPGVAPVKDRSIWLLAHSDLARTARVRAFVDFIAAEITARKAEIRGDVPPLRER